MGGEWAEERFGNLVQCVSDKCQVKEISVENYISTENMVPNFGGITLASRVPLAGSVTKFSVGDTLFSNIRTYFKKVWQAQFDGYCSNDVLVFRSANDEVLAQDYLHQICRWERFTELSVRTSKGAKMPRGDKSALADFKFLLPPINEQRAIAHILGTLDDKIELNRRRNQTLEAMARALFKDWFVDFGPVRAKMEGREPYLPADLWQLFPDRLDDEGKPEGWKDDCLGSFTNIKNGYAFKSKDWCEAGVPVVKIGSVKPSFVDISQVSFIDVTLAREKESFRLNVGDMLVGLTGYVGETGRIPPTDNRPMLNQRVGKFEPFDSLEPFVFACVRMPDFKVFAESKAHGSAQANVSTTELLKYPVVNPGRELLEAFCRMLEPLFLKSLANEGEQATLSRLRDTLLPKLISGELRITDAEKFLERAEDNVPNKKRSLA